MRVISALTAAAVAFAGTAAALPARGGMLGDRGVEGDGGLIPVPTEIPTLGGPAPYDSGSPLTGYSPASTVALATLTSSVSIFTGFPPHLTKSKTTSTSTSHGHVKTGHGPETLEPLTSSSGSIRGHIPTAVPNYNHEVAWARAADPCYLSTKRTPQGNIIVTECPQPASSCTPCVGCNANQCVEKRDDTKTIPPTEAYSIPLTASYSTSLPMVILTQDSQYRGSLTGSHGYGDPHGSGTSSKMAGPAPYTSHTRPTASPSVAMPVSPYPARTLVPWLTVNKSGYGSSLHRSKHTHTSVPGWSSMIQHASETSTTKVSVSSTVTSLSGGYEVSSGVPDWWPGFPDFLPPPTTTLPHFGGDVKVLARDACAATTAPWPTVHKPLFGCEVKVLARDADAATTTPCPTMTLPHFGGVVKVLARDAEAAATVPWPTMHKPHFGGEVKILAREAELVAMSMSTSTVSATTMTIAVPTATCNATVAGGCVAKSGAVSTRYVFSLFSLGMLAGVAAMVV
ncbi:hypothetical protein LTR53_008764 [Teratosphaeriaceae sp. CCFEE 6253]|nr:hypothetical protein LTR53_008764 [Teratosphaeriaceae sp. CCFEE 6253]